VFPIGKLKLVFLHKSKEWRRKEEEEEKVQENILERDFLFDILE